MRKRLYSEQRKKPDERPKKRNKQKGRHKMLGSRRRQSSTNLPMLKQLKPKLNKPVTVAIQRGRVLEGDCEGGWDDLERQIVEVLRHVSTTTERRDDSRFGSRSVANRGAWDEQFEQRRSAGTAEPEKWASTLARHSGDHWQGRNYGS